MPPPWTHRKNAHNSKKKNWLYSSKENTNSLTKCKSTWQRHNKVTYSQDWYAWKASIELEGVLVVTRNANSLLEQEVDNLQQYQRRTCIIVDSITPVKDETEEQITKKTKNFLIKNLGFEERKVNEELDKCHRLGKAKDGKQSTIIRFKSHSFRASVYASRNNIQNKKKLKVKLSLTKRRTKIINYAHRITESVPEVMFAYADVNGNLKIRLHEQREGKYTFPFISIDSLHNMAGLYQTMMCLMMKMFKEVIRNTFLFLCNITFRVHWFIIWG